MSMTIESYIQQNATRYPHTTAIVAQQQRISYLTLQQRISQRAGEYKASGYHPGQIVCLRALPTVSYLVDYFALHTVGCVVAPLEKDLPNDAFERIASELCGHRVPEGSADILYTTGTTGRSKGVIISHETILAWAENLISGQGFTHNLAFVVNGPLNHIGSLSKIYPVILLGATIVIVDGLKDLNAFFAAFNEPAAKVATFLVPASIRMLLQLGAERLSALSDRMDFIETGAAAISHTDMLTLCRLLPHTRLYNTYASTETGIISTYNFNVNDNESGHYEPDCLGRPMKHAQVIITPEGLIACKGKTLMTGYLGDPERTTAVLRDGILYTSDMGRIDAEGRLHLTGRADDVINVGGFKVAPTEVEDAALGFPDVEDCVCIVVPHVITGKALKLLVVMKQGCPLSPKTLARYLKSKLETYKVPLLYAEVTHVERTFNGKINRKHYWMRDERLRMRE